MRRVRRLRLVPLPSNAHFGSKQTIICAYVHTYRVYIWETLEAEARATEARSKANWRWKARLPGPGRTCKNTSRSMCTHTWQIGRGELGSVGGVTWLPPAASTLRTAASPQRLHSYVPTTLCYSKLLPPPPRRDFSCEPNEPTTSAITSKIGPRPLRPPSTRTEPQPKRNQQHKTPNRRPQCSALSPRQVSGPALETLAVWVPR